jgi:hypothetical protein
MRKRPLKVGDTYPGHVLRDEYGMNAENRPTIIVNEIEVPEAFQALIPYVERWAIPCDVTRCDYFDKQSQKDIATFWNDVNPHTEAINNWLDSQPDDIRSWSQAAIQFMYFLKAHAESYYYQYQPTEEEIQARQEIQDVNESKYRRYRAIEKAVDSFKLKDYVTTVELLSPFETELDKIASFKLSYARKKIDKN